MDMQQSAWHADNLSAFEEHHAQRRQQLYGLLGDLPPRHRPIAVEVISRKEHPDYVLESLVLDLNGLEPVAAYFVSPRGTCARRPCILYSHAHGGNYAIGKEELIAGCRFLLHPPYARELTGMGYSALCIDAWNFGSRRGMNESDRFKLMLWNGQVLWGMMVYDSLRAVDYLVGREDVIPGRVGAMGLSMGSTMSWWLAALDSRIKVCVDLCCLTDFQALIDAGGLAEHGLYYYVPHLLQYFTAGQINALIAPRPHLSLAGNYDPLTPPVGLERIDAELKRTYAAMNAPEAWRLERFDSGHVETAGMRALIVAFLRKWL